MKTSKKRWAFTPKQKAGDKKNKGFSCWGISLKEQQKFTTEIVKKGCVTSDFLNENYLHPNRTGRNNAKYNYW